MKISELPQEVQEKARKYQSDANQNIYQKDTDDLINAFNWQMTKEGFDYWLYWNANEEPLLYKLQQLRKQYPNDMDFGNEVSKLIEL